MRPFEVGSKHMFQGEVVEVVGWVGGTPHRRDIGYHGQTISVCIADLKKIDGSIYPYAAAPNSLDVARQRVRKFESDYDAARLAGDKETAAQIDQHFVHALRELWRVMKEEEGR